MPKTYKEFVKEYAMGLQVPATSFLKPIAALNPLRRKENTLLVRIQDGGNEKEEWQNGS